MNKKKLIIRNPSSTRPWQHVIEPLHGYIKLAEKLASKNGKKFVGPWNFGPNKKINLSVLNLAKLGKKIFNSKSKIIINTKLKKEKHEAKYLSINSTKAQIHLKWKLRMNAKESLKLTFDWFEFFYKNRNDKKSVINLTLNQIQNFHEKIKYF